MFPAGVRPTSQIGQAHSIQNRRFGIGMRLLCTALWPVPFVAYEVFVQRDFGHVLSPGFEADLAPILFT
jgi:hypothetical protein